MNLIGISTPSHPGNPFLDFVKLPFMTGTSEDWKTLIECNTSCYNDTLDLVYYLNVPENLAAELLQRRFNSETIRKQLIPHMWGKIGRIKMKVKSKADFIPGAAADGPIRHGKRLKL